MSMRTVARSSPPTTRPDLAVAVCIPEWLFAVVLLAAVARGALRDYVEHSPRFQTSKQASEDISPESKKEDA